MEFSSIKYKWANSMDNSPLKYLKMDAEKRLNKIQELSSMIVTLKKNTTVDSKKTIQKLQQQIDELIHD
jgi:hypothetical protein|tara:strand:- start:237 stop:443 length:207 start_codon:yes stop_codon:yes gene_type:complete